MVARPIPESSAKEDWLMRKSALAARIWDGWITSDKAKCAGCIDLWRLL